MPRATEAALIALVFVAAWSDLRTSLIPNSITVSGAVVALLLHAFYGGIGGAMQSLTGAVLGLAIFVAFYAGGGMGAGDVKLFGWPQVQQGTNLHIATSAETTMTMNRDNHTMHTNGPSRTVELE